MKITRLSNKEQWTARWSATSSHELPFNPAKPSFREIHSKIKRFIDEKDGNNCLEVGAYPGKHLWYFHKYHNLKPWGVEYVESAASRAQEMLNSAGVPAHMIVDDFFDLDPADHIDTGGWDVVASFGFVDHFDEPEVAVARHLDVTRDGGLVVISVPNHFGWNGNILKAIDPEKWQQHNGMSLPDLISAFKSAGCNDVLFSAYIGHIGFWNTALYRNAKSRMGAFYPLLRGPLWIVEKLGQWLVPNNRISSPDILIIARKNPGKRNT
jgi:SAM-dependent methyltransferase